MSSEQQPSKKWYQDWAFVIITALIIATVIRLYLFAPYEVHGSSMYPTLKGNEMLVVNKIIYAVSEPSYGDIIVFHTDESKDFIKRVIGLPGDSVEVKDGKVYRNGKMLHEPYVHEEIIGEMEKTSVPPESIFVLGDNRNNSKDSRQIGAVALDQIVGRADLVVLPLPQFHVLN